MGTARSYPSYSASSYPLGPDSSVPFFPSGGIDDWPALNILMAQEAAGQKRAIVFAAGTYYCATPGAPPSNTHIIMGPGVRIVSSLVFSGLQRQSVFYAQALASGQTGTVTATPTLGGVSLGYTVVAGAAPTVGQILIVSKGLSAQVFTITARSGAGPYTLTLDRPIAAPFTIGDPISILTTRPSNILIEGNGATISGTGDRVVQIVTGYRCEVNGLNYDDTNGMMGDVLFAYDIGGVECLFRRCSVVAPTSTSISYGFALEANERSGIEDCSVLQDIGIGCGLIDCIGCWMTNNTSSLPQTGAVGYSFCFGTGASLGCFDCYMSNCRASGGKYGLVFGASTRCLVSNCAFNDTLTNGILLNGSGNIVNPRFVNVTAVRCAGVALAVGAGNPGVYLNNCDFSAAGAGVITCASDLTIDGLVAVGLTATMNALVFTGASFHVKLHNLQLTHSGTVNAINFQGSGRLEIDSAWISMGVNSFALYAPSGGGSIIARNVITAGSAVGTTGASITNATLRHKHCNFTSCGTAITLGANGYSSKGTLTLTGAVAVVVPWTALTAQDTVSLTLVTRAGTYGGAPDLALTPTTGFSVTGQALDTSVYAYEIT